jgi:hypothetical protein
MAESFERSLNPSVWHRMWRDEEELNPYVSANYDTVVLYITPYPE